MSRVNSLIEETDIVGMVDLTRSIPDHSLLRWTMTMNFSVDEFVNQYHYSSYESCFKTKYDVKQLPQDWLGSESSIEEINRLIRVLEESEANQSDIDNMYNDFVKCIKSEMLSKLSHRTFRICGVLVINLGDVRNPGGIWS